MPILRRLLQHHPMVTAWLLGVVIAALTAFGMAAVMRRPPFTDTVFIVGWSLWMPAQMLLIGVLLRWMRKV